MSEMISLRHRLLLRTCDLEADLCKVGDDNDLLVRGRSDLAEDVGEGDELAAAVDVVDRPVVWDQGPGLLDRVRRRVDDLLLVLFEELKSGGERDGSATPSRFGGARDAPLGCCRSGART